MKSLISQNSSVDTLCDTIAQVKSVLNDSSETTLKDFMTQVGYALLKIFFQTCYVAYKTILSNFFY